MSAESEPGRIPDLLQVRCPSTLPPPFRAGRAKPLHDAKRIHAPLLC
jgi:hypothetical protein